MRSLVLPWGFWFCREVFCFCRAVFGFAVTIVGHSTRSVLTRCPREVLESSFSASLSRCRHSSRYGGRVQVPKLIMVQFFAPCKGIQNILGFWIPRCGFRIPGTGFRIPAQWIPDSKKRWIPIFYCFNAFLCISFSCSNLAKLKDVVTMHNKFVFRFINYGLNVLQFCKGLWYNKEGDIGGLSTPQHRGNWK